MLLGLLRRDGGEVIDLLGRLRGGLDEARRADLVDAFEPDPTTKGRASSEGSPGCRCSWWPRSHSP